MSARSTWVFSLLLPLLLLVATAAAATSSDGQGAGGPAKDPVLNYAGLEAPFRTRKCNLVWEKARKSSDLAPKLKALYLELRLSDKEELALKALKSSGKVKDGDGSAEEVVQRETEVRRRFAGILNSFGLGSGADPRPSSSEIPSSSSQHRLELQRLFKDKKLEKLWQKALKATEASSGKTQDAKALRVLEEELQMFKAELRRHQERLDRFHDTKQRLNPSSSKKGSNDNVDNHLGDNGSTKSKKDQQADLDVEREEDELKRQFQRLRRMATNGIVGFDHDDDDETEKVQVLNGVVSGFQESVVEGLWKLANEAAFDEDQLKELKKELKELDDRFERVNLLQRQLGDLQEDDMVDAVGVQDDSNYVRLKSQLAKKLKKLQAYVKSRHQSLAQRIASRHTEL